MRPFLPTNAYNHVVSSTNLAGLLNRHNLAHAPQRTIDAIDRMSTATAGGCFTKAVATYAVRSVQAPFMAVTVPLVVSQLATGSIFPYLVAHVTDQLVGRSTPMSPEHREALHQRAAEQGITVPEAVIDAKSDVYQYGVLGGWEKAASRRALVAHASDRGLAHAAWTGVALGFNTLLWLPRVALAVCLQTTTAISGVAGGCYGAVRFGLDAILHLQVRDPAIYGTQPRAGIPHHIAATPHYV